MPWTHLVAAEKYPYTQVIYRNWVLNASFIPTVARLVSTRIPPGLLSDFWYAFLPAHNSLP